MIEQLFEVATEFRFDVGQALINTQALQEAVDGVSKSSNSAIKSLGYLASGLVAHLGFGSGGLLTVLSRAVQLAEEFDSTALGFSNVISSNMQVLSGTIDTFNDRLGTSKMILDNISDVAIKFALPTSELAKVTELISPALAQHGRLGTNFSGGIEMAKNLMLSSEMVQLNPQMMAESLQHVLSGGPLHEKLFSRFRLTQPFEQMHIRNQQQLAMIQPEKKLDLLSQAFKELAGDSEALDYRLSTLRGQFTILQDLFSQLGSVLKPIGDAIRKPLVQIIRFVTDYFKTHAKVIGEQIGALLTNVLKDPKGLLITIMQLRNLGADFHKSLHMVELLGSFRFLSFILEKLGIQLSGGLFMQVFGALRTGFVWLATTIPWLKILTGSFRLLSLAFTEVIAPFLGFLFIFQTLSRARAIAKVHDAVAWLTLTPELAKLLVRLKVAFENIMLPINVAMDHLAKLIAPLFETTFFLKLVLPVLTVFVTLLEKLGHIMVYVAAATEGYYQGLFEALKHPMDWKGAFVKGFTSGYDDFLKTNQERLGGDKNKAVAYSVTNIGKIEARFDMREQLEPDRIAFAVTEHIKRLASNPTQGRGNSFSKHLSGALDFSGGPG